MRVYLVGFMGCGKSTAGRLAAAELGWTFVDLDAEIESANGSDVATLFERLGEPGFRRLETKELQRTRNLPDAIVATGGGILTVAENRRTIAANGLCIWLDLPFADIIARLGDHQRLLRPLWRDDRDAERLFRERLPGYRMADVTLDLKAEDSAAEVAARIVRTSRFRT